MIKVVLLIFCLLFPAYTLSFELNDRPWGKEELQELVVGNLLINGDFSIPSKSVSITRDLDGYWQIRKCWGLNSEDYQRFKKLNQKNVSGIYIGGLKDIELIGRPLIYKDVDNLLRDVLITVKGEFLAPQVFAKVLVCNENCSSLTIPLAEKNGDLVGYVGKEFLGAMVSSFTLVISGGVNTITSVSVGELGASKLRLNERDLVASEICQKPPGVMSSAGKTDLFFMSMLTVFALLVLWYFVRKQEWFLSVVVSAWLAFSFFGVWGLYFGVSEYRLAQGVVDRSKIITLAFLSIGSLLLILAGWLFSQKIFSFVKISKQNKEVLQVKIVVALYVFLAGALCLLAISGLYSFLKIYFNCDGAHCATYLAQVRQEITDLGFLKPHYQRLLFYHLTSLLSYSIIWRLLTRKTIGSLLLLVFVFFIQVFLIVYNGEKAPVLWYGYGLLFIFFSSGKISSRCWSMLVLSLAGIIPLLLAAIPVSLADRLSFGSLTVAYKLMEVFPAETAFLGGKSLFDPLGLYGGNKFDLPFYLWRVIHPELLFSSIRGTSVTAFWGEGYANFGWTGFVLSTFLMGLFFGSLVTFVRRYLSIGDCVSVSAWLIFRYIVFAESLFLTLILDFFLIGIGLVFAVLYCFSRIFKVDTK